MRETDEGGKLLETGIRTAQGRTHEEDGGLSFSRAVRRGAAEQ